MGKLTGWLIVAFALVGGLAMLPDDVRVLAFGLAVGGLFGAMYGVQHGFAEGRKLMANRAEREAERRIMGSARTVEA